MERRCEAFPGLKDIPHGDSALERVNFSQQGCELSVSDLLCLILLDLIESQEGILRGELTFERVEKDLLLGRPGLTVF